MQLSNTDAGYRIWGADKAVYGPVELPVLIGWIKEERVLAETWVYSEAQNSWYKASKAPELQMFFHAHTHASSSDPAANPGGRPATGVKPGSLRRIKLLSEMTDEQLLQFMDHLERIEVRQWTEVVKQGQPGDAMYFVLEGELRVRLMIAGKESVLTTLAPGEVFGEMAMVDDGPRSADVVANQDSVLLKLTGAALSNLRSQAAELASPFLFALGKSLAARIRADNKRFRDSVNFARSASGKGT